MLSTAQIQAGYTLVFREKIVPTTSDVNFWKGLSADNSITSANFPQKLAAYSLTYGKIGSVVLTSEQLLSAKTYLYYEQIEEVLTPLANFSNGFHERIQFNTDVLQSRYGLEQRYRLLHFPKSTLEFDILLYRENLQHFTNQLQRVQGQEVWIPLWQFSLPIKTNTLGVWDLSGANSGKHILYAGYSLFELVDVVREGDTLFFEHQPALSSSLNAQLIPVRKGNINESIAIDYVSVNAATGHIAADLIPQAPIKVERPTDFQRIAGIPLFNLEQNWTTPSHNVISRPTTVVDYNTGVRKVYDLHGYSDTTKTLEFLGKRNKYGIRDFFLDCAGRYAEFFLPTFTEDLTLVENFNYVNAQKFLLAKGSGFSKFYAGSKLSKFIYIEFKSRPAIICEIGMPTIQNGIEQVPIKAVQSSSDPFGYDWNASEVHRISYLPKCRFSSDTIEINWITGDVYTVTTSFITVQ